MRMDARLSGLAAKLGLRYTRYADGTEELYDHRTDPMEWTNLAGNPEFKSVVLEHRRMLNEWIAQSGDAEARAFAFSTGNSRNKGLRK